MAAWGDLSQSERTNLIDKARAKFKERAGRDPTSTEETSLGKQISDFYSSTGNFERTLEFALGKAYDTASNLYPQGAGSQPGESKTWGRLSGADRTDIIGKARDAFRIQAGRDPTSQEETELGTKIAAYYDQTNGDVAQTITYGQKISSEIGTSKIPGPPPDITKMTDAELRDVLRAAVPNVSVNAPEIGAVSTLIQDKLRAAREAGARTMDARRAQSVE